MQQSLFGYSAERGILFCASCRKDLYIQALAVEFLSISPFWKHLKYGSQMRKKCFHFGEYSSVFQMQYGCICWWFLLVSKVLSVCWHCCCAQWSLSCAYTGPCETPLLGTNEKILQSYDALRMWAEKLGNWFKQNEWYNYLIYGGGFAAFCSWYIRNIIEFLCIKIGVLHWSMLADYTSVTVLFP